MSRSKRRSSQLNRKVGTRPPRKRIVVVCEGEKTEPGYLELISAVVRDAVVQLVIVEESATTPKQLVDRACSEKEASVRQARRTRDPNAEIDEVWCAFDVDEHPLLKEACEKANANGVQLAVSNPCVEIWFLLHFVDQRAYIDRHAAQRRLANHIPGYNKTMPSLDPLLGNYEAARDRAQRLTAKHEGDGTEFPSDNPSTGMWRLVEAMKTSY